MLKINPIAFIGLFSLLFITSCDKDEPEDPIIPNEEEVITTLKYTLTPVGGGETVLLTFQDLDGDGGDDPIFTVDTLQANVVYNGSLELLNELESPAEDITEEIEEEALDHQFFYQVTDADVNVVYDDMDDNGNPIGLLTTVSTNDAGAGTITVILRHEPDKDADGVAMGDITNAGGETDIEVTFNVNVE